jgi:hypothetical protein
MTRNVISFFLCVYTACSAAAPAWSDPLLFDYETKQLTQHDLVQFSSGHQAYFAFDDNAVNTSFTHDRGACKSQPSDTDFPPLQIWEEFNASKVINGALIATHPLASPCYRNWGNYDEKRCAAIMNEWTNPYLQ